MKKNAFILSIVVMMALASSVVIARTISGKTENAVDTGKSLVLMAAGQDTIGSDPSLSLGDGNGVDTTIHSRTDDEISVLEDILQVQDGEFLLQEDEVPDDMVLDMDQGSLDKERKVRRSRGVTPDRIFKRFRREPGAIHMRIPKFLLSIGSKAIAEDGDMDEEDKMAVELINNIDNMRILVLEDCSKKVQRSFIRMTSHMDIKGFERVMQVKDGGDKVDILVKESKGVIREAIFVIGGSDCVLLHFKGKFRVEDLNQLMKMKD